MSIKSVGHNGGFAGEVGYMPTTDARLKFEGKRRAAFDPSERFDEDVPLRPRMIRRVDAGMQTKNYVNEMDMPLKEVLSIPVETYQWLFSELRGTLRMQAEGVEDEQDLFSSYVSKTALQDGQDISSLTLGTFLQLTARELNENMDKIPNKMLALLSYQQARDINLSTLSHDQLISFVDFTVLSQEEGAWRFARLLPWQIDDILENLTTEQCALISDEKLIQLNYSSMTPATQVALFPPNDPDSKRRFGLLSPDRANKILGESDYKWKFVSDEQLPFLDVESISHNDLSSLFPIDDPDSKRRFGLLKPHQVNSILQKLMSYQFSFISDEQLPQLRLNTLCKKDLEALFRIDESDTKHRFELLTTDQFYTVMKILFQG
jgi:hypothetical protein